MEDMVMRSVYLRPSEDGQLRQLAHELHVTKSDLIRSAIGVKLREWLDSNSKDVVLRDLAFGRRDQVQEITERAPKVGPLPQPSGKKAGAPEESRLATSGRDPSKRSRAAAIASGR